MKHRLTPLLLSLLLVLTMTACSAASPAAALDASQVQLEQKLDDLEQKLDALEGSLAAVLQQSAAQPASTTAATEPPAPAEPAEPVQTAKLPQEEAEKIALEYAGFTTDQVARLRTEFEIDDGIPQYDVEFHQGDWEYEFEIHAETGTIISFDKDHKYD